MAYIFMDESGCLGFNLDKKGTSRNFMITFLCVKNKRPLEKIVKSLFRKMTAKERARHCGTLHATRGRAQVKHKLLQELKSQKEVSVFVIRLNKNKVYSHLQNEKVVLYNYVTNILLDRLLNKKIFSTLDPVDFIASRRETNILLNENFKSYLTNQWNYKIAVNIHIKTPSQEKCLQIVDCLSWSVFRKYEFNDESYYQIIKDLIVEDKPLFS